MTNLTNKVDRYSLRWKRFFTMDVIISLLVFIMGLTGVLFNLQYYRGIPLQAWVNWALIGVGIGGIVLSIAGIRKRKIEAIPQKSGPMTDEEYAQAKAELDMMYFKEHGKMPEEPKDN